MFTPSGQPLLLPLNGSKEYKLHSETEFRMGEENPPLKLSTDSEIEITQKIADKKIISTIRTKKIEGYSETIFLNNALQEMLVLAEICPEISFNRDKSGRMQSIENRETIENDWKIWREQRLPLLYPSEKDQQTFIANFEKGIEEIPKNFRSNLQYVFLMPEIYSVIFPPDKTYTLLSDSLKLPSRLLAGCVYEYRLKLVKLEEKRETVFLILHSILTNEDYIKSEFLKPVYSRNQNFSVSDFKFFIEANYLFSKADGQIINAELNFVEQIHHNLAYKIAFQLD